MPATQQILGVRFFDGPVDVAVETMMTRGGFLVAPAGTCFSRLREDEEYRRAITGADLALADSGLMAVLWRVLRGGRITRISGLRYLQALVDRLTRGDSGAKILWVVPNAAASAKLGEWWQGRSAQPPQTYLAPFYGRAVADAALLESIAETQPDQIVIGIGAGPQEKLGYFLRERLSYRPAIHCIGGALGVLTGDQKPIPTWADRLYLGWLFRLLAQPTVFIPRLWRAHELPWLIARYGRELPPLRHDPKADRTVR